MTQANGLLGTIEHPESELDLLLGNGGDENFETPVEDEEQSKTAKGKATRRRTQTKKKHYTEDSIRLYLQEIGRIRPPKSRGGD